MDWGLAKVLRTARAARTTLCRLGGPPFCPRTAAKLPRTTDLSLRLHGPPAPGVHGRLERACSRSTGCIEGVDVFGLGGPFVDLDRSAAVRKPTLRRATVHELAAAADLTSAWRRA